MLYRAQTIHSQYSPDEICWTADSSSCKFIVAVLAFTMHIYADPPQ